MSGTLSPWPPLQNGKQGHPFGLFNVCSARMVTASPSTEHLARLRKLQ